MSDELKNSRLTISETGLKLIRAFEGYRPVDRELVTGQRVVGYGHRLYSDKAVMMGKREAEQVLRMDLEPFEEMINSQVHAPISQSQFDALCSFSFNIGPKAFLTSETLRALNNGRPLDAANGLDIWRKSEIAGKTYVVDALMRRRTAEKALFLRTDRELAAGREDLPPVRDTTIVGLSTEDALPIFTDEDTIGLVAAAPQDAAVEYDRRREDGPAGALQLSEFDVVSDDFARTDEVSDENLVDLPKEDDRLFIETPDGDIETGIQTETIDDLVQASAEQDVDLDLSADFLADVPTVGFAIPSSKTDAPLELDVADEIEGEEEAEDEVMDMPARQSPIAAAATDIVARLDALIEDADARFEDKGEDWPESLITAETLDVATDTASNDVQTFEEDAFGAENNKPVEGVSATDESGSRNRRRRRRSPVVATLPEKPVTIIDELAQDDAFRIRSDSAAKYIQSRKPVQAAQPVLPTSKDNPLGLWIPVILGFLLLGLAGGTWISGAQALLGDWGSIIAFTGFVIGIALILTGVYAALRINLRD